MAERPATDAVLHASFRGRAILDVLFRLLDDLFRDGDTGIAASSQSLHLGDAGRAFIEVRLILRRDIAPATPLGLSLSGKLDRLDEHSLQVGATLGVLFLAEDLREKQHRESVPVGVVIVVLEADQPLRLRHVEQIIDCQSDVLGILPTRRR